jgi:hypothetical protein
MIIVEQPFRSRRDGATFAYGPGDRAICLEQLALIVREPVGERPAATSARRDRLMRSETLGVLFQPLDAEKFLSNGIFIVPKRDGAGAPECT